MERQDDEGTLRHAPQTPDHRQGVIEIFMFSCLPPIVRDRTSTSIRRAHTVSQCGQRYGRSRRTCAPLESRYHRIVELLFSYKVAALVGAWPGTVLCWTGVHRHAPWARRDLESSKAMRPSSCERSHWAKQSAVLSKMCCTSSGMDGTAPSTISPPSPLNYQCSTRVLHAPHLHPLSSNQVLSCQPWRH